MGRYLGTLNAPLAVIGQLVETTNRDMAWLDSDDLRSMNVVKLDNASQLAAVPSPGATRLVSRLKVANAVTDNPDDEEKALHAIADPILTPEQAKSASPEQMRRVPEMSMEDRIKAAKAWEAVIDRNNEAYRQEILAGRAMSIGKMSGPEKNSPKLEYRGSFFSSCRAIPRPTTIPSVER